MLLLVAASRLTFSHRKAEGGVRDAFLIWSLFSCTREKNAPVHGRTRAGRFQMPRTAGTAPLPAPTDGADQASDHPLPLHAAASADAFELPAAHEESAEVGAGAVKQWYVVFPPRPCIQIAVINASVNSQTGLQNP